MAKRKRHCDSWEKCVWPLKGMPQNPLRIIAGFRIENKAVSHSSKSLMKKRNGSETGGWNSWEGKKVFESNCIGPQIEQLGGKELDTS